MNYNRECGGCRACCTVNGIEELGKPIRTHCQHECPAGCAIYGDHPESCQTFACVWLRGFGTPEERPDLLGVFVEERSGPPDGRQMIVKEIEEGACSKPEVLEYLGRLKKASGLNVYVINHDLDTLVAEINLPTKAELRRRRRKKLKRGN